MPITLQTLMAAAQSQVPRIDVASAQARMSDSDVLVLDVRDAPELEKAGRIAGAHHVPRGMLEFRADPASPYHDPAFRKDRTILVYCASGGRSALAGKLLQDMGFSQVYNLGGFKDWVDQGGAVEERVDPGM